MSVTAIRHYLVTFHSIFFSFKKGIKMSHYHTQYPSCTMQMHNIKEYTVNESKFEGPFFFLVVNVIKNFLALRIWLLFFLHSYSTPQNMHTLLKSVLVITVPVTLDYLLYGMIFIILSFLFFVNKIKRIVLLLFKNVIL